MVAGFYCIIQMKLIIEPVKLWVFGIDDLKRFGNIAG
jgi:hypothetical protein